jgi:hypothetical protein
MIPWLNPLQCCWRWLSYAFFTDLEKTRVLKSRSSVMETTEVIACAPTVHVRATSRPESKARLEKRRTVRYPCDRVVRWFANGSEGETLNGRLRNLSVGGLGFVAATRIEPGESLVLELDDPLELEPRVIAVTVVHARPMPIRGWFHGCALAQELADGDVRTMVG